MGIAEIFVVTAATLVVVGLVHALTPVNRRCANSE
jgi:hypothetical protein